MSVIIQQFGERGILLSWQQKIDEKTSKKVHFYNQRIKDQLSDFIIETVTTYCSLMVLIKQSQNYHFVNIVKMEIEKIVLETPKFETIESKFWKIPVCYDLSFGQDLQSLSQQKNLTIDDIINLHCEPVYIVSFIGFLPGFPYLQGLNPKLITPRLSTPRLSVAKGSVAIGGSQTGIYPQQSPGGWHIIGRTPFEFFNPKKSTPCILQPMDSIQFYPISIEEFQDVH